MAQVTTVLPDFTSPGGNAARIRFQDTVNGLVDATALRTLAGDAIVTRVQINADQDRCFMQIVATLGDTPGDANPSLSSAWEIYIPAVTLQAAGLDDIEISGPNAPTNDSPDTSEPYSWQPGDDNVSYVGGLSQWVTDFKAAYAADNTLRATLVLDDGVDNTTEREASFAARAGNPTATIVAAAQAVINREASFDARAGDPTAAITAEANAVPNREASFSARAGDPTVSVTLDGVPVPPPTVPDAPRNVRVTTRRPVRHPRHMGCTSDQRHPRADLPIRTVV